MAETRHQRRVTVLLLDAIGQAGFALAGSGAIREHGITNRPTQDVDLFALSTMSPEAFLREVEYAEQTLRDAGLSCTRSRTAPLFARLIVSGATDEMVAVDLAVDWRMEPPVRLEVGPVLAVPDAVGNKVAAVFSRGEARDFLDLDAIRESHLYSDETLLNQAVQLKWRKTFGEKHLQPWPVATVVMSAQVDRVAFVAGFPDIPSDPGMVVANPHDEVTPESFTAWLDRRQAGEPVDPGVRAADTLAGARAAGAV
jgi:hypothetical protein